jgi:hypothetical protein
MCRTTDRSESVCGPLNTIQPVFPAALSWIKPPQRLPQRPPHPPRPLARRITKAHRLNHPLRGLTACRKSLFCRLFKSLSRTGYEMPRCKAPEILSRKETFGNRDPSARWTFFDPAPPRFAAKTKLALRAQTVVFAGATLRGQGAPENLQCALPGSDFQVAQRYQGVLAGTLNGEG